MPTTLGFPYPTDTDLVQNVDEAIQALAEAVNAEIVGATGVPVPTSATLNQTTVRRRGRTGLLLLSNLSLTANVAANGTVLTLPVGFRPAVDWNGTILNVSSGAINLLSIASATGVCTIRNAATTGQSLYGSVAFPL